MMEDKTETALEDAIIMTFPEQLTLTVLREKLGDYGMECSTLSHTECVRLFYNNLAALPCRHATASAQVKTDNFSTFTKTKTSTSKPTTVPATTTASTPEMDRLLARSKKIKQVTPPSDEPKVKVMKLNVQPKAKETTVSNEPTKVDDTKDEPKEKEMKLSGDAAPSPLLATIPGSCKQQEATTKKPRKLQRNFFPTQKSG